MTAQICVQISVVSGVVPPPLPQESKSIMHLLQSRILTKKSEQHELYKVLSSSSTIVVRL